MSLNNEILSACDHVVVAAANGLYQGMLVVLVAGLCLRVLSRTNATTRHAIWFATLVLVAALIPAHFLRDYVVTNRPAGAVLESSETASSPPDVAYRGSAVTPVARNNEFHPVPVWTEPTPLAGGPEWASAPALLAFPATKNDTANVSENAQLHHPQSRDGSADLSEPSIAPDVSEPGAEFSSRAKRFLQPISWRFTPGLTVPRTVTLVLLVLWVAVGGFKTGLVLWRLHELRKLKASAVPAGNPCQELFQRLRHKLAINRNVELKMSRAHRSPVLLGFLHPVVLLPVEHTADAGDTEAILRHELAHVRRGDDWANLFQQLVQAILFFHPGVWWIGRQLSIQREIACDDLVLQEGGRPRAYALLLTDLASRINTRRPLLAPGVTTSKSQLQKRIDMILNSQRNTSPRLARSRLGLITSSAALMTALVLYAAPRLVLAQAPAPVAPPLPNQPAPPEPALVADLPPSTPFALPAGPKAKTRNSVDRVTETFALAAPVPVAPAVVAVQPVPGHPPQQPAAVPHPAPSPRPMYREAAEGSFEQRLRRLEKMVESLLERKEPKPASGDYIHKDSPRYEVRIEKEAIKQFQETAKREAERQANQARRAVKDAETAIKLQQERDMQGKLNQDTAKQLEALHKQREMLEREVERVERQIERLEQEQQEREEQHSQLQQQEEAMEEYLALVEPCAQEGETGAASPKK